MNNIEMIPTISDQNPFNVGQCNTEWRWADEVPLITQKFGRRPKITPVNHHQWYVWDTKYLDKVAIENSVLYLEDGSTDAQIQQLYKACENTGAPHIIVTDAKIRSSISEPENVHLINTSGLAYQYSKMFDHSGIKPTYKRKVADLKHTFLICSSNPTQHSGQLQLLSVLEELGILKDALYSSPEKPASDVIFAYDRLGINTHMKNLEHRVLGEEYIRFDHYLNLKTLTPLLDQCHFHVARGQNGFNTEYQNWGVDEKCFQGYTTTCPVLPIWSEPDAEQMQEWGFKFKNIPSRHELESIQDVIIRWCGEILFYNQMTQNKDWAQSWQDSQGENTIHNFELLKRLHHFIWADIEKQIDQIPKEFQNL